MSLPKKWAQEHLSRGESVSISVHGDSLLLNKESHGKKIPPSAISFSGDKNELLRKVISAYLNGRNEITVNAKKGFQDRGAIKNSIKKKMPGLEVVDEGEGFIRFRNLLVYSTFPFRSTLKRMHFLVRQMLSDLSKGKTSQIEPLEEEVDRFFLLGIRQLISAASDAGEMKKLKIESQTECLLSISVIKVLEKIGDHAFELGERAGKKGKIKKEGVSGAARLLDEALESFFEGDPEKAERVISSIKPAKGEENGMAYHGSRIYQYITDIAEITINLSFSH